MHTHTHTFIFLDAGLLPAPSALVAAGLLSVVSAGGDMAGTFVLVVV